MTRFPTRTSTTTTTSLLMTLTILLCPIVSVTSWSTTTTVAGPSFGLIATTATKHTRTNHPKTTLRQVELQMSNDDDDDKWDEEEHLAHGLNDVHEETSDELKDSEEAAAWDAHDLSDPGMEAAAEERAVMLANEITHKMKEELHKKKKESPKKDWNDEHLAHGIDEVHEETSEELLEAEDAAAVDAHDVSDAGMEAAAEERAVMIANEMVHKMKEKAAASAKASADKKTKE